MFKSFVVATLAIGGSLPAAIAGLMGLIAASEKTGFDKLKPEQHQKLVLCINSLLELAIDHWIVYIILAVGLAFIWTLIVTEPKQASKRTFEQHRQKRLGNRK